LVAEHALIAVVRYQDRERHRLRWPIKFYRDYDERLSVARLRTESGNLRIDLDRHRVTSDDSAEPHAAALSR
jgi:hypothetical protein